MTLKQINKLIELTARYIDSKDTNKANRATFLLQKILHNSTTDVQLKYSKEFAVLVFNNLKNLRESNARYDKYREYLELHNDL